MTTTRITRACIETMLSELMRKPVAGLMACAFARMNWPLLPVPCQALIEGVEARFIDGSPTIEDVRRLRREAGHSLKEAGHRYRLPGTTDYQIEARANLYATRCAYWTGSWVLSNRPKQLRIMQHYAVWARGWCYVRKPPPEMPAISVFTNLEQAHRFANRINRLEVGALIRCVFGPEADVAAPHPDWLSWNGGVVPIYARTIEREGRFQELPILADALEEAGCQDEAYLAHCRLPGHHARGCWVLRSILAESWLAEKRGKRDRPHTDVDALGGDLLGMRAGDAPP